MTTLSPRRAGALALALVLAAAAQPLAAQSAEPVGPRARSWGGEVMFPEARASLLRFTSSRTALVLTLDGAFGSIETEQPGLGGGSTSEDDSFTSFTLGVGVRRYGGTGNLRPVSGVGVFAGRAQSTADFRATMAGAYGEFGAHWFLSPHASLGAVGELRAMWERQTIDAGLGEAKQTRILLDLTLVRVGGAVYF